MSTHTWPIVIQYHSCKKCGKIIESRQDYKKGDGGFWYKALTCPRCHESFLEKKHMPPVVGVKES